MYLNPGYVSPEVGLLNPGPSANSTRQCSLKIIFSVVNPLEQKNLLQSLISKSGLGGAAVKRVGGSGSCSSSPLPRGVLKDH